ncbi:hypothetical protein [Gaoshiqia sediminis]|uniref:Uncharacterized protein n=1 Tax=Gaoshiqia sediminis TaxID=2986998 RepID=A0AA42C8E3_9BACT|nr:hypothetical protein [Gaoshiqia sediminis]MCW0482626.1 hypothetical protein [Gaoshiqia sediminis]
MNFYPGSSRLVKTDSYRFFDLAGPCLIRMNVGLTDESLPLTDLFSSVFGGSVSFTSNSLERKIMERQQNSRQYGSQSNPEKRRGGSFLGTILIIVGLLWILKEFGWQLGFPAVESIRHAIAGVFTIFRVHAWTFGLPVLLLIAGVLLVIGHRGIGIFLLVLAVLLFMPHLIIPGILAIIFFPVLLIIVGIILLTKLL